MYGGPFRAIDYKFDARSNQCVFVVSRALFDLDYHSCSVNVEIVLKTKEKTSKKLNFHAEMPHN